MAETALSLVRSWLLPEPGQPWAAWLVPISLSLLALYLAWHYATYGNNKHGPTIYPFIGNLPDLLAAFPYIYDRAVTLLEESPTMTYFSVIPGVKEVITANPDTLQHILKDNFANYPKGPVFQESFRDLLGHGIFNSDGEVWKGQRKTASLEFSNNSLRHLMLTSVQQEVSERLLPTLEQAARTGEALDIQDVLLRYTFDNICRIGFGVDPGCLAPGLPEIPFAKAFDIATKATMQRNLLLEPVWKFMRAWQIGSEADVRPAVKAIDEFTDRVIQKRKREMQQAGFAGAPNGDAHQANGKESSLKQNGAAGDVHTAHDHTDILSRMIALGSQDKGQLYSDTFLRDACTNFILAGRDTSSVALSWLFWLLTWHPEVEDKMVAEVQSIIAKRLPGAEDAPFNFDELRQLTYTHAAINESLRLYPSVPADSKYVLADDVLPDGTAVRKGWRVMYAIYAMGRMTRIWGPNARDFKPERWLTPDGQLKLESPFKFPAFNAGPRLCLGRDMAYLQMKSVTSNVLRRYKLRMVPGHKVEYVISLTLFMKHGLKMHVLPRLPKP